MVSNRFDKVAGVSQLDHSLRDHTSGTHSNFLQRKKIMSVYGKFTDIFNKVPI